MATQLRAQFIRFCVEAGILRFGEFSTKAGRQTPYFFNAGLFNDGLLLRALGGFYADTLIAAERDRGLVFDMLFGPAYKGIPLAAATAMAFAERGRRVPFAFNRKEAKDHGEGGTLIGAPLAGKVVVIDDVITAGTSVRESAAIIEAAGARLAAVAIALDRQERGGDAERLTEYSAAQEVERRQHVPVLAIANLDDLLEVIDSAPDDHPQAAYRDRIAAYRSRYGVVPRG